MYDMVITITGLDMARRKRGRMSRSTAGYAYVGGACVRNSRLSKISSVALVEDSGAYSGVVVTAHEIAHLLGAVHDGDAAPSYLRSSPGAKACPWKDGYMMSDLRRTSRGLNWSPCSIKQMSYFLKTSTASCLYNKPRSRRHQLQGSTSLPGTGLSLNAQCQADRGTNACFHDSRVCTQLFCYYRKTGSCYASRPAAEGSSCGNNKHCLNGKCVKVTSSYMKQQTTRKPKSYKSPKRTKVKKVYKKSPSTNYKNNVKKIKNTKTKQSLTNIWSKKAIDSSRSDFSRNHTNFEIPSKNSKQSEQSKVTVTPESGCSDSIALMGSLSCDELFQRYSFHYCKRNRTVKTKCCVSYKKHCSSTLPR